MMEGIKGLGGGGGGGGGKVDVGVGNGEQIVIQDQDMGDGMQCSDHPFRNNPGGICAFCLQEKLGKLVSSSFPLPVRNSASSSSSPSFRSDITGTASAAGGVSTVAGPSSTSLSLSLSVRSKPNGESFHHDEFYTRRARMSFLLARKKKKVTASGSENSHGRAADMVFKRSKSTTTPRRGHFMDAADEFSPRKRNGFWSFLYQHHHHHKTSKKIDSKSFRDNSKISSSSSFASSATTTTAAGRDKSLGSSLRNKAETEVEDDSSPNSQATASASASSFERKVSRSRSVGCGSRSFSGDFFERISTGFGDCTLRRVESQREGKPKHSSSSAVRNGAERVKCGGLFSGFMMTSSSSSSSSSSYWVSSAEDMNGKAMPGGPGVLVHGGRSRSSWGWAFASPMRAFSKTSSKDGKRDIIRQANTSDKSTTPNLSAIPSLLSVRG
ncbi:uncharacterized protein LOC126791330 [Argentina anserina]|uniref:uncharacterized protein LOC126791330 n=1 Tax=Argentina anserina TaxID=57926 RepID=UPI0021767197|nr:uncharacterized protein LOC126791330 [Potentilla anserina]